MSDIDNWDDFFSRFPHGVIVLKDDTIVHAVGYPNPASQEDAVALSQELAEDEELGLTQLRGYTITPLSGAMWQHYVKLFAGED